MLSRLKFVSLTAIMLLSFVSLLVQGTGFQPALGQNQQDDKTIPDPFTVEGEQYLREREQQQQDQAQTVLQSLQGQLEIHRSNGDRKQETETLLKIGEVYKELAPIKQISWGKNIRDYTKTIAVYRQAIAILDEIGEHRRKAEVLSLLAHLFAHLNNWEPEHYLEAVKSYQQAIVTYQAIGDQQREAAELISLGKLHHRSDPKNHSKAVAAYEQALAIYQAIGDRQQEAQLLITIGKLSPGDTWGPNYPKLIEYAQQALKVYQELNNRSGEAATFITLGHAYRQVKQYPKAITSYQQALALTQTLKNFPQEISILYSLSQIYLTVKDYPQAIYAHQQAAALYHKFNQPELEVKVLIDLSLLYHTVGQYSAEKSTQQQAIAIAQAAGQQAEMSTLINLAIAYKTRHYYSQAIEFTQQALIVARALGNQEVEMDGLVFLGDIHLHIGPYSKAIAAYQRAIDLFQNREQPAPQRARMLGSVGRAYYRRGQYAEAIQVLQQALELKADSWGFNNRNGDQLIVAANLGATYRALGQYQKAINLYQQTFTQLLNSKGWNSFQQSVVLDGLGTTYLAMGNPRAAVTVYQQALEQLPKKIREGGWGISEDDFHQKAIILDHLGSAYQALGQNQRAIELHEQALTLFRQVWDRTGEADGLHNLGNAYWSLNQPNHAIGLYQQALAIRRELGDRAGEGMTLSTLGRFLEEQNQPELAIVFYKDSVNVREKIRQDLRVLPQSQQESYTQTVASTYRRLADILLKQNRVLEAQQVLDLLKVQELEDYLENVRGNQQTAQGIDFLLPETEILKQYNALQQTAIQLGQELTQLRKLPETSRTSAQQQRITQLVQLEDDLTKQFNQFTQSPDVVKLVAQLSPEAREQSVSLKRLNALRDDLKKLNAVLLYPLILDDRLELVITTPDSPPLRRTILVKREELNATIVDFRRALQTRSDLIKVPAQKLHSWLIKPLEADLKQAKAQTIIYAPDGQLRYIPLSALHNGEQWLVQQYRINNITAESLTEFKTNPVAQPRVLAGAYADKSLNHSVNVAQRSFSFAGLPFAGREVDNLSAIIPNTTKFLNQAFTLTNIKPRLNEFSIVHLATHGAVVPGKPDDSFILFGDGKIATISDIESWSLQNVDLVVLSACETGLGGKLGNGEEILGLGYQFQRAGSKAAIASLWQVDDGGTQALMNAFYAALKQGMTKAQALQEAQRALITGNYTTTGGKRADIEIVDTRTGQPQTVSSNTLQHPYYWAPFILIGNGL